MSAKIYYVYRNDLILDILLVTDKKLSEINIKDVIPNVETYEHYQDEHENDFYKINNKDIVSFSILNRTEKIVVEKIVVDKKEEKVIGAKELIEKYYNVCLKVEFNSDECAKNREVCEYFTAQMRLIEDIADMDLREIKEKAFQKAKADYKSYMCY